MRTLAGRNAKLEAKIRSRASTFEARDHDGNALMSFRTRGWTALIAAAAAGHGVVVKTLASLGAKVGAVGAANNSRKYLISI